MDVWFGKDRSHVSWERLSVCWRGKETYKQAEQKWYILSLCWLWKKIAWLDSKVVQSHLIKRGFKKSYTIWTTHGEIDNALLEVDRGEVRDDNSHYQDRGVFDGADHGIDDDDDDFDYEELLRHVEPQVLNSMGTDRGLDNMELLEKSSREHLYDESNGCSKEFT